MEKICPFCEVIFDQELIKDHIEIEHLGLETEAFQSTNEIGCNDCDKKFTSQSDLKIHQNIAHPSFKFACEKCEVRFLSESSLNLHSKLPKQCVQIMLKRKTRLRAILQFWSNRK